MKKFTVVTHYGKNDEGCRRDYWDIEVLDENGRLVIDFGDCYHDRGKERLEGFLQGVQWATNCELEITYKDVADRK